MHVFVFYCYNKFCFDRKVPCFSLVGPAELVYAGFLQTKFCKVKNSCLISHSSFTQHFGTGSYWTEMHGSKTDWFFVNKQPKSIIIIERQGLCTLLTHSNRFFVGIKEWESRRADLVTWCSLSVLPWTLRITWLEGVAAFQLLYRMFYPKTGTTSLFILDFLYYYVLLCREKVVYWSLVIICYLRGFWKFSFSHSSFLPLIWSHYKVRNSKTSVIIAFTHKMQYCWLHSA